MEPALKQRLLGAAVLVALAVTFLPLLVMDPAPESGASTVPLKVPAAPKVDGEETIEMAIGPAAARGEPVLQAPAAVEPAEPPPVDDGMFPPTTAGGDYAVTFGRYATAADADRVVAALRASQLAAYHEPSTAGGRTLHRVLIGPFANRATAESARLRAAHVNDQVSSQVITLDAGARTAEAGKAPTPAAPGATGATATTPARPAATAPATPPPAPKPATPAPAQVATTPPAAAEAPPAAPAPAAPAASGVGYAVQLGAFANAEEATRLRDRARAAGFSAFVERVETANGTLSRVRVGPVTDRADAERLQAQVAGSLGVNGIVRPHP